MKKKDFLDEFRSGKKDPLDVFKGGPEGKELDEQLARVDAARQAAFGPDIPIEEYPCGTSEFEDDQREGHL